MTDPHCLPYIALPGLQRPGGLSFVAPAVAAVTPHFLAQAPGALARDLSAFYLSSSKKTWSRCCCRSWSWSDEALLTCEPAYDGPLLGSALHRNDASTQRRRRCYAVACSPKWLTVMCKALVKERLLPQREGRNKREVEKDGKKGEGPQETAYKAITFCLLNYLGSVLWNEAVTRYPTLTKPPKPAIPP